MSQISLVEFQLFIHLFSPSEWNPRVAQISWHVLRHIDATWNLFNKYLVTVLRYHRVYKSTQCIIPDREIVVRNLIGKENKTIFHFKLFGPGGVAWWIKHLLPKHENQNSDSQSPQKKKPMGQRSL